MEIQHYWKTIFQVLSDIAKQSTPPTPELAILNLNIESVPQPFRHVTTHILLAARLSITRLWKTDRTPSVEHTFDMVNHYYSYEITMAASGGLLAREKRAWQPSEQWSVVWKFL